jgi:hypothetical protein
MKRRTEWISWAVMIAIVGLSGVSYAAPPWKKLIPFKKVAADPNTDYWINEDHGPWMIMATSFAGPGAEQQARSLVMELRSKFNLPAYMHKRHFDYTEPVVGLGLNKYGGPKRMRYQKATEFDEIAVLVGSYNDHDAPAAQEDLEAVKYAKPDCLDLSRGKGKQTTQRFVGLRELHRLMNLDPNKHERGPMRRAFIVRNPLLPKEFFVPDGIDPFVVAMNERVTHSLLKNPGTFTVRVASFQGKTLFDGEEKAEGDDNKGFLGLPKRGEPSQLELAADRAHRLTEALRKRGVEAYEFHDRCESIVTIGSFDSVGTPRADGKIEINPSVLQIMNTYGAQKDSLPGAPNSQAVRPKSMEGIRFDVQPIPVRVPSTSLASTYADNN